MLWRQTNVADRMCKCGFINTRRIFASSLEKYTSKRRRSKIDVQENSVFFFSVCATCIKLHWENALCKLVENSGNQSRHATLCKNWLISASHSESAANKSASGKRKLSF